MVDLTNALTNLMITINMHMMDYYNSNPQFNEECRTVFIKRELTTASEGRKYIKLIRSGSVMAFIEKETGNIYKPASWQAPAKGVRGNLFSTNNGLEAFNFEPMGLCFVKYAR